MTATVLDALDRDGTTATVARAEPDVVLHLMTDLGTGDSASNAQLRSVGTRNLVDAARAARVDRIIAQSISWTYPSGPGPATEADPLDLDAAEPRRTTITAVRTLEEAVHEVGTGVVLRFGQLYGPGTWYARLIPSIGVSANSYRPARVITSTGPMQIRFWQRLASSNSSMAISLMRVPRAIPSPT